MRLAFNLLLIVNVSQGIWLWKSKRDAFDGTFGSSAQKEIAQGYDEANDYDREIEKPENVKWDDDAWKGYSQSFAEMEKANFATPLKEKDLVQ